MKARLTLFLFLLYSYIYAQNTIDVSFCSKDSIFNFNTVKQVFFIIDKDTLQLDKTPNSFFRYTNNLDKITDTTNVSVNIVTKSKHTSFLLRKRKLNTLGYIEICFDYHERRFKQVYYSCSMGGYYSVAGYAKVYCTGQNF